MTTITKLCQYPSYTSLNVRLPGGQETFKQHIKDLDQLLIDVGLIRTTLANQLDTNNIDDLDLSPCFSNLSQVWQWDNNQVVYYKPIEYAFVDEMQATMPVKIKFEFFFFRFNRRVSNNIEDKPYFGCKITATNGTHSQVIWQHPYINRSAYDINFDGAWPIQSLTSIYSNKSSMICYDRQKGYFALIYCPSYRTNIKSGAEDPPTMPCIFLVLNRSHDENGAASNSYVRIISSIISSTTDNGGYQYGNASMPRYNSNRQGFYSYIMGNNTTSIYESNIQFQTPYNATAYYNNGKYFTYASIAYDTTNKEAVYDPFILVGNKVMGGYETALMYDIKLNDGETKKYLAISQSDMPGYPYNENQCLLLYYN